MSNRLDVVSSPGKIINTRWFLLNTPWLVICLHRWLQSDDWDLHNHECSSTSIILWGTYFETIGRVGSKLRLTFKRSAGCIYSRPRDEFHRISLPPGAKGRVWSLFLKYRIKRGPDEGYLVDDRFVPLREYDESKGQFGQPCEVDLVGVLLPKVLHKGD